MTRPGILVFAYHDVGCECLAALLARGERVLAVFTHADDPHEEIWFRSVAEFAIRNGLPVYTPASVNTPEWIAHVRERRPDILFSFYYRHLIGPEILAVPRLGAFNVHGSLLPRYRGRAPINWAVLRGETQTGATLHYMVDRPDAGDIVDQEAVPIGPQDTAREVFGRVTAAARRVLERSLEPIKSGDAPRRAQDESQASTFGGRRPEHGRIDWHQAAGDIFNLIRAVTHPYPGAFTELPGRRLTLWWALPRAGGSARPGTVLSTVPLTVATGQGSLEIRRMQWQGAPEQSADTTAHGLRAGDVLGGLPPVTQPASSFSESP